MKIVTVKIKTPEISKSSELRRNVAAEMLAGDSYGNDTWTGDVGDV